MKYTNIHGWSQEIVAAITKDRYKSEDDLPCDFSASMLVNPAQQIILKKRYKHDLKVRDVSEMFWAFMGSLAHIVLEESWNEALGSKVEERLYTTIDGKVISGKFDCYHNGEIKDYKTTKVYKIQRGNFTDWEAQLNIYAELLEQNGYEVNSLKVEAILFDYKEHESYKENYPKSNVCSIPLRLWSKKERQQFLKHKVAQLTYLESVPDEDLPECNPEEIWQTVQYIVIKEGAKKATRVFDTEKEAELHLHSMKQNELYSVQQRLSTRLKCEKYCDVSNHCCQYQATKKASEQESFNIF